MKIRKMTANFGTLHGESLELGEGLNIITAPNERGKSTWCAFLKSMLFGVDSSQRAKAGVLPDKTHYAAWDGGAMAGEMDLLWQDKEVTLSRSGKASAPMRDFQAVYSGTLTPVQELTGISSGETLTGVSRTVFESSAFIGQSSMRVTQGPELEKRIAAIVSSGDEEISFSETEKKLGAWQRRRRYRTNGELPEIERALEEKYAELDEISRADTEIDSLTQTVARQQAQCETLREQMTESRKRERKELLARSTENRKALHAAEQAETAARAEAQRLREKLSEDVFGTSEPEEAEKTVREVCAAAQTLHERAQERPAGQTALILLILAAVCALAGVLLLVLTEILPAALTLFGAAVVLAVVGFLLLKKRKEAVSQADSAAAEREKLLAQYGVSDEEALLALTETHAALYGEWTRSENSLRTAEAARASAQERQQRLDAQVLSALDFSEGDGEAARLGRQLKAEEDALLRSREALAAAKGRIGVLGDPLVLKSEIESLHEKRERLQTEYDAISVALDVLRGADEEMQTRFSPQLGARATELFEQLTDGKYDRLTLDKALSAQAKRSGDALAHDALYLSAGTFDQLYLALRLAICDLALPDGDCPLVLDDALVSFDDARCEKALSLLRELAKQRQILLFTCHGREAAMLADCADVRKISL